MTRRGRDYVKDLDIVLVPAGLDATQSIIERVERNCDLVCGGLTAQNLTFRWRSSGFQLDSVFPEISEMRPHAVFLGPTRSAEKGQKMAAALYTHFVHWRSF